MTNETKSNENDPKSQELLALEQKRAKINKKIAQQKEKERKHETRRKIIVGGWILALARTDESFQELLESRLYPALTDARDRELFKLNPVNEKTKSQDGHSKILVRFPGGKPNDEVLMALKAAGNAWKWDATSKAWTGEADPETVRDAVAPLVVEIKSL